MNRFPVPTTATSSSYHSSDTERRISECGEPDGRTPFQRDRARILHSSAFRRLAGKTQVVAPTGNQRGTTPRNRLTHSLECAQIARDLGQALGCDPDLVDAAGLAHDLGHPPFGHNGEQALNEAAKNCRGFEGNAQTLRLLTRIEPKRITICDEQENSAGLNLTRAMLDAVTKYPWPRGEHPTDPQSPKFGCYEDDQPVFTWLRAKSHATRRCIEAQIMDWADDVAYSTHDVEDGIRAGYIAPELLRSAPEKADLLALAAQSYAPHGTDPNEMSDALDRLMGQAWWPAAFDGSFRAQARLKNATSELIGRFTMSAFSATRNLHGHRPLARYDAELVLPRATLLECAVLKAIASRYVMQNAGQRRLRAHQRMVIAELVDGLSNKHANMDPQFRDQFDAAPNDSSRLRAVIDQIASLTDAEALAWHSTLAR